MYMKKNLVGDVLNVITCAKFQKEIFRVTILPEVEFSIFLLIFEWALQQCSATALPVIGLLGPHESSPNEMAVGSPVFAHLTRVLISPTFYLLWQ